MIAIVEMDPTLTENTSEITPATQAELSRFVADNAQGPKSHLIPTGGRTALDYGYSTKPGGQIVALTKLTDVIDYPARDMTITVEAGIRMEKLAALLQAENQRLPIDIAQAHRATLGGCLATNTFGPRRFGHGTFRDYVIGISAVDAQGRLFQAGGRVVKNVAGYDLCKMLVGSMGTLAVITQVTLKLRPQPETNAFLCCSFDRFSQIDETLEKLLLSEARPVAIEVLGPFAARNIFDEARLDQKSEFPLLCLGVEGTQQDVSWQLDTLKKECDASAMRNMWTLENAQATAFWKALTEFQVRSEEPLSFQASLLPSQTMAFLEHAVELGVSVQAHAADGVVIGHLPDSVSTPQEAEQLLKPLRDLAAKHRGNVIVLSCPNSWKDDLSIFGTPESSWKLMKELKRKLDPNQLLNSGRFIDHLE